MAIEGADEQQGAMTVPELMGYYRISRSKLYAEIRDGRLRFTKIGRKTIFTPKQLRDWELVCEREAKLGRSPTRA
jgi:excisionase family DNA binding protein